MYEDNQKSAGSPAMPGSAIEGALITLHEEIDCLEKSVITLISRADKVSIPPPPPMPGKTLEADNTGPHSVTWHRINDANSRIASIIYGLDELTGRLET